MFVQIKTKRQRLRRIAILISFILFPVVLNYLSPYLIIDSASNNTINGSFIYFGVLFLSSLLFGRLWCAWGCVGAGMQEIWFPVNDKPAPNGKWNWIKWAIWIPWILGIILTAISAGGYHKINFFYNTEEIVSVTNPFQYITYYTVVGSSIILSLTVGKRGFCHYVCWMSPFMILGRKLRNLFNWPALRLKSTPENCSDCLSCTRTCPMSLDVHTMVQLSKMENSECILCGNCVDGCSKSAIAYTFSRGK